MTDKMNANNGWMRVTTKAFLPRATSVGDSTTTVWVPISDAIAPGATDGELAICDGELLQWSADHRCWVVLEKVEMPAKLQVSA